MGSCRFSGSTIFIWTSTSWPSATPGSSSSSMVLPWTLPCIVLVMLDPPIRRRPQVDVHGPFSWCVSSWFLPHCHVFGEYTITERGLGGKDTAALFRHRERP